MLQVVDLSGLNRRYLFFRGHINTVPGRAGEGMIGGLLLRSKNKLKTENREPTQNRADAHASVRRMCVYSLPYIGMQVLVVSHHLT